MGFFLLWVVVGYFFLCYSGDGIREDKDPLVQWSLFLISSLSLVAGIAWVFIYPPVMK